MKKKKYKKLSAKDIVYYFYHSIDGVVSFSYDYDGGEYARLQMMQDDIQRVFIDDDEYEQDAKDNCDGTLKGSSAFAILQEYLKVKEGWVKIS